MARHRKVSAAAQRIIARLNGLKVRHNRKRKSRRNPRRSMFGGLALRTNRRKSRRNGLALRTNGRRSRRNGKRRSARRNPLALRTNGRKSRRNGFRLRRNGYVKLRMNKRKSRRNGLRRNRSHARRFMSRRNGLALRTNGRRKSRRNGRFMKMRHNPRRRSRRNPSGGSSLPFVGKVRSLVGRLPVVGKPLSGIIGPAALGAVSFGASALLLKYVVGPYVLPRLPAQVSQYLAPVGYTAMGAVTAALVKFVPGKLLSSGAKNAIAGTAVLAGAVADIYRYSQGTSSTFGDGGYWQLGGYTPLSGYMPLGGAAMGDAEYGASTHYYARNANLADAGMCGPDLDASELGAAAAGPRAWSQRFPMPRVISKMQDGPSPLAQRPGHRWGWLIRMIGMDSFQALAQLPPAERQAYIMQLKQHAISSLPAAVQAQQAEMAGLVYAGGNYAAA